MNFEKTVNEVKGRLETVGEHAQDAAKASLKTLKAANEIVLTGVQNLVKTQAEAAKDLYTASKKSFDKAVAAGLVAVATNPIEYLPSGRDTLVGAFNDSIGTVTKTGEKLVKAVKTGYENVAAALNGKPQRKTRKAPRKTARKASESTQAATA